MGLAERDYYRDSGSTGTLFRLPQSTINKLLLINVAAFFLNKLLYHETNWITQQLTLNPAVLFQPWLWWKFVTYGFAHDWFNLMHLAGNMFCLWMFGREIEGIYGKREFLRLYLVSIVLCGLFWVFKELALQQPLDQLLGASGAVTTVVILYCLHFPKRTILLMAIIPMPAWIFGILLILMNVFQFAPQSENSRIAFDVHLVGAVFGFVYCKFGWNFGRLTSSSAGGSQRGTKLKTIFRRQPKLRLHHPEEHIRSLDREADRVLDKLHRDGEECLTDQERAILADYSRRMRQKLQ